MSKKLIFKPELTEIEDHPAYVSWKKLDFNKTMPSSIDALQTRSGKSPKKKSLVYRLNGMGNGGASVIAKRTKHQIVTIENLIYNEILPGVPVTSLFYYGCIEDDDKDFGWLFLEEARGTLYREDLNEHRTLAAKWFSVLHTTTSDMNLQLHLPYIGSERYLSYLRQASSSTHNNMANPALNNLNKGGLFSMLKRLDLIESRWTDIQEYCDLVPHCLAHGDFYSKNVHVRSLNKSMALYVFDWEYCGWGIPLEDLGGFDPNTSDLEGSDIFLYWTRIKERWPHLDLKSIQQIINIGKIFRYLSWIEETSNVLKSEHAAYIVDELELYDSYLKKALKMATFI